MKRETSKEAQPEAAPAASPPEKSQRKKYEVRGADSVLLDKDGAVLEVNDVPVNPVTSDR